MEQIPLQQKWGKEIETPLRFISFSIVYHNNIFKKTFTCMHSPPYPNDSNSQTNQRPLHQSFIVSPQQPPSLQPVRVQHQPIFTQPPPQEKIMYKSSVQPPSFPQHSPPPMELGKLDFMAKTAKEHVEEPKKITEKAHVYSNPNPQALTFRRDKPQKPKMASSVIFFNKASKDSFSPFESVNASPAANQPTSSLGGLNFLTSKARCVQEEVIQGEQVKKSEVNPVEQNRKNREMFKSSIEGQSRLQSKGSFSQMTFNNQFPKGFRKLQFHRNTPAKNVAPQYSLLDKSSEKADKNTAEYVKSAVPVYPDTPNASRENTDPQAGKFKKKSPYVQQAQAGKTDANLLKMLGISAKTANKEAILTPKSFDFVNIDQKCTKKGLDGIKSAQKKEINKQIQRKFSKDEFLIGKKMGKGQFGEVMLVQHKITGFICGMKVMSKKQIKSQKYQNQIARQLSIQFYLRHRNVTPLYGYFEDEENFYLLVEFCTDGQLLQKLRKNRRMQEDEVSPIIREICEGLDYVHKQEIIHRDIKPENILFSYGTVKISDFGWAVHCGNGMRKTISGSPLYYSPEIVQETSYDQKIDIWSIGMMTYECLLGKIPFRIYSELDLNRIVSDEISFPEYVDVSDEAKDFILGIMKKKPEERMQMREILRHPFITKYAKSRKLPGEALQEFRSILRV